MKHFLRGLLGLGLLFLNSCEKEVLPRIPGPGIVKLKSWYWQNWDGSNEAGFYHYDSQNRRIKYDVYEDSSFSFSYRYIWNNDPEGLTSEVYYIEDGDSTFRSKYFWNSSTGFVDSIVSPNSKTIYKIRIAPSGKPELIERTVSGNTSVYICDSVYDGMIVRSLWYEPSQSQDTVETVYSYDDYYDFYDPYQGIPAFNALNRNAYFKQRKYNTITFEGIPNGFASKWLYDDGEYFSSQEWLFE